MEFTLYYKGPLKSNGDVSHKHDLRRIWHRQLRHLWLQRSPSEAVVFIGPVSFPRQKQITRAVGPFAFAPVVCPEVNSVAELSITLLRPEAPGSVITSGGDIDNRLKTLFDSLKVPGEVGELPKQASPGDAEEPFLCLLSDDKLVTKVAVSTDRLLDADAPRTEVVLMVHVVTRKVTEHELNLGLL